MKGRRIRATFQVQFTPPEICPPNVGVYRLRGLFPTLQRPPFWGRAANAGMRQTTPAQRCCRPSWCHRQNHSFREEDVDDGAAGKLRPFVVISGQCCRRWRRWFVCVTAHKPVHIGFFWVCLS